MYKKNAKALLSKQVRGFILFCFNWFVKGTFDRKVCTNMKMIFAVHLRQDITLMHRSFLFFLFDIFKKFCIIFSTQNT